MKEVIIYTDGSCLGNPGPGGWAAILTLPGTSHRREIAGGHRLTTNNRMEIMAAVEALSALKEACKVRLVTDSRYLCDSIEKGWLKNWQAHNWVKKDKKPVLNVDLWKQMQTLLKRHQIRLEWIRGHQGHPENERCDELARAFAARENLPSDLFFEQEQNKKNLG